MPKDWAKNGAEAPLKEGVVWRLWNLDSTYVTGMLPKPFLY